MQQEASNRSRRQHERRSAKAYAFVHHGGRFQRATVLDYSVGGLQLEGTFGLIRRDAVLVELIGGSRLHGRVAWSLGTRTGIVFPEPLAASHPAMLELARRAGAMLRQQELPIAGSLLRRDEK